MPLLAITGLLREARILRGPGIDVIAGGGAPSALAGRIERALRTDMRGLISIGIGGGLASALQTGDVVIGRAVLAFGARVETDDGWTLSLQRALPGAMAGDVLGSDAMVTDRRRKAELHQETGALAVDMESHIVAAAARDAGVPFAVLRVISDPAWRSLPPAVTLGIRPDGGMNIGGVARAVAADPMQIPALIRAGLDARAAFRALFRCRHVLGPGLGFPDLSKLALDMT